VDESGKLVLKTAPHVGKRDIFEYLTKVYNIKVLKVNSLNFPGKLKRSVMARGQYVYRTKAFKKFFVTIDQESRLPEDQLNAYEAEVVQNKT
jgi:ribosomal protein L23